MADSTSITQLLRRSILDFVDQEIKSNKDDEEMIENLEIVKQCLENSYSKYSLPFNAPNLLEAYSKGTKSSNITEDISESDKNLAETLKNQGNQCMKDENYTDAISCYTEALKIHKNNAVYLCNRAAAFSKKNMYIDSIADCKMALQIDPNYSKAYGRMGLAYSSLGDMQKSIESYKKAIELDPSNESAQQNLKLAEAKMNSGSGPSPNGLPGGFNLEALETMASQLIQNPNMANVLSRVVTNLMTGAQQPNESQEGTENASNQQNNPENPQIDQETIQELNQEVINNGQQLLGNLCNNPNLMNDLIRNFRMPNQTGQQNNEANPPQIDSQMLNEMMRNFPFESLMNNRSNTGANAPRDDQNSSSQKE